MIIIGLTGPSGSGKTTLCRFAGSLGIKSIDADKVYHELLAPPSPCLDEITLNFGRSVLNPDGALDRASLASVVFGEGNKDKLDLLNSISHKYVKMRFREIIAQMEQDGERCVIIDAPTLFESGFDKECSFTVSLLADRSRRAERIISRDGLSNERAELRLNSQKPDEFFISNADHVIYNNGDTDLLTKAFSDILRKRGGLDEN